MTKIIYKRELKEADFLDDNELIFYKDDNIAYIIVKKDNNYILRKKKIFNNQQLESRTIKTISQILKII